MNYEKGQRDMKGWRLLLFGVLIGLLTGGAIFLVSRPVRGVPITLHPAPTSTKTSIPKPTNTEKPIRVQVNGQIFNPGLYDLSKSSRIADLIALAGGITALADESRINLAAQLEDGDYIYVPSENESIPETASNAPNNLRENESPSIIFPININQADQDALESLPGIGPTKASDILAYREINGPFSTLEELLDVPGIGPATLEMIKEYLMIEP